MILDTIAQATRRRVENARIKLPLEELKRKTIENGKVKAFHNRESFAFEKALKHQSMSFICEVKKASPSKGMIAGDFPYQQIAADYEKAGANAISVLTEPDFFQGSNDYLTKISRQVNIPVLRKDFTIDEYQLYEAKLIGADAVLLICSLLEEKQIREYLFVCDTLGLSALVEAHTRDEVESAVRAGARMIGVNNRNLQTFEVNLENSIRLRNLVPENIIFVAESGIQSAEDIKLLRASGVDAVLIGETLMRSDDKGKMLSYLKGDSLT